MVTTSKKRTRTVAAQQLLQIANEAASTAECWEDIHNAVYGVGGPFSQSVHAALAHEAEQEGVSLNQLIVAKLSAQLRDVAHV